MKIFRKAEKTDKGMKLITETIVDMTRDDFEGLMISAFNQKESMEDKLNLLKSRIRRLSDIELTDELKEFMEKLRMVGELKELEKYKEDAKELEKQIDTLSRDLIQLRTIQSEMFKDTNKGNEVKGTTVGERRSK